ncbi:unnamed protein product [Hydatigera taeniaeformis]|uniref:Uncharacterized protein n=1 Tax=Hydatigena taeniaeformis TaxID=6205 RepID=A0A0R3X8S0_HYDTA|nr:unnamed protein product [Hydatigera taeniaeformis]
MAGGRRSWQHNIKLEARQEGSTFSSLICNTIQWSMGGMFGPTNPLMLTSAVKRKQSHPHSLIELRRCGEEMSIEALKKEEISDEELEIV